MSENIRNGKAIIYTDKYVVQNKHFRCERKKQHENNYEQNPGVLQDEQLPNHEQTKHTLVSLRISSFTIFLSFFHSSACQFSKLILPPFTILLQIKYLLYSFHTDSSTSYIYMSPKCHHVSRDIGNLIKPFFLMLKYNDIHCHFLSVVY